MHRVHDTSLSKAERRQLWEEIIADYHISGETLKTYSRKYALNYDHLSYYSRAHQQKISHKKTEPVHFVAIDPMPLTVEQKITLRCGSIEVDIPLTTPVALMCQLIKELKSC